MPSPRKPALVHTFSVLPPTPEQTLLLRACLWAGEAGRRAWAAWRKRVGDPIERLRAGDESLKGLLPLIFAAVRSNGVVVEETLRTRLHTAALREELRINAYRGILQQVLSACAETRIPAIVVNGAALADTVYESPSLRHTSSIVMLIGGIEPSGVVDVLCCSGFSRVDEGGDPLWGPLRLNHDSGLPLYFRRDLFHVPYYRIPFDDLWIRSHSQPIGGVPAQTLSPADTLLHVCGDAFFSRSRQSLLWVFDSWFIVARYPNLDWDGLLATARRSHMELPLAVTMGYLVEQLGAAIPVAVVERLSAAASRTSAEGRAHAFCILREEARGDYGKMLRNNTDWRARAQVAWWLLRRTRSYLRRGKPMHRLRRLLGRWLSV